MLTARASCHSTMELYGIDAFKNGNFSKQQLNFSSMLHRQIIYWCMCTANLHIIKSGTIRLKTTDMFQAWTPLTRALDQNRIKGIFQSGVTQVFAFYMCFTCFFGIVNTPLSQHDCTKVQVKIGNFWWPKIGSTHLMLPAIWCWEGSMFEMQVMPGPFICPMKEAQEIIWLNTRCSRIEGSISPGGLSLRDSMKKNLWIFVQKCYFAFCNSICLLDVLSCLLL